MADDNDKNKKGFSGLSDLASNVSGIDEPVTPEPKAEAKPSTPKQPPQHQREAAPSKPELEAASPPPTVETVSPWSSRSDGTDGKWIIGIIGVIFVFWLINNAGQSNKEPSYTPAPAVQTPSTTQSAGLQYTKPSVGTDNVLSVSEISWCIRESIRIDAMRNVIGKTVFNEFNLIINDYNSRCGRYRYRQSSKSQAKRDVEAYRSQIVLEAIRDARQLSTSYQSNPSVSPSVSTSTAKPNTQYTREAQQLLTDLGYDPGPVDGDYGRRTADAVKAFQRDVGITQDGWIDEDLLSTLRRAKTAYKPPVVSQPKPQSQASIKPRPSNPTKTTTVVAGYFTRGSHKDDVLRLQGTPSDIDIYSNTETWWYGSSQVEISKSNDRVIAWNNSGNLKIRYSPGSNTTSAQHYTRGSHKDDVLRLQGTPSDIDIYSNTETWWYGSSQVEISTPNDQVVSWNNSGNLKVK